MIEEQLTEQEKQWLLDRRAHKRGKSRRADPAGCLKIGGMHPWEHYAVLRRRAGITAEGLGRRIGMSPRSVAYMESGKLPFKMLMEFWGE